VSSRPRTKLAVLGSPIHHSKSPAIHRAAYAVLGLDWSYAAAEVTGGELAGYLSSRDASWRGLSLTMPLKRDILPLLDDAEDLVDLVGAANTVVFDDSGMHGHNTDVQGVVQSFRDAGVEKLPYVHILGAGATAASVIAGVAQLGAAKVLVSARTPEKATPLVELGDKLGIAVVVRAWGIQDRSLIAPDAIVSTLPGGANDMLFAEPIRERSVLFDIAYDPWPSDLATAWEEVGGTVIPGIDLLVNQAVGQIRLFLTGDRLAPLPDEPAVVAAMRAAVWED
jgi:shikimate dehydrogenase